MKILLTGATGFIGRALLKELIKDTSYELLAVLRSPSNIPIKNFIVKDILPETDWKEVLSNIDIIIHLAARVHVMRENSSDPLSEFRRINVATTLNLARQAAKAGVRRFIFLSSIKVYGENSQSMESFTAGGLHNGFQASAAQVYDNERISGLDPYGRSKFEAEKGLCKVSNETKMEVVIIRPPLVYGDGVKGNFLKMMKWVNGNFPLPFGGIKNQRSLVYIENLTSLITVCIQHPKAANQTFLVSDDQDLSTSELIEHLANFLGRRSRLINIPPSILKGFLLILGRRDIYNRLCGNLQVDIRKTCELLDWKPPFSVANGLNKTAKAWLEKDA